MEDQNKITYFAKADFRNKMTKFGIKPVDRTRHMYVIGKTGMGKSTLLENLAVQDIQSGNGCGFIDPHGGTAELLLDYVPEHRIKDVIYFAPFDTDYPVAFNVMEDVGKDKRHLVASGLMSAFKKIWVDAWSARMEYILGNTLLALLEFPGATLLGVNRMYSDKDYRKKVVDNITDPSIKSFWVDEYAKYGDRYTQEATPAIQNKIGQFVSNPLIRNIIGQSKSTFDIREVMDGKKILIMNLSKGRVGDQNTSLLGSMLITKIYLAAMSRADVSAGEMKELPNFYFFVDEFQSFANESFADILSEARKYKLNLTIAHQYIEQMPEEVRSAVFGNVGTMITFRVGSYDAEVLEKEFQPAFTAEDIVNLDKYQLYLRLMIDGVGSRPFSAVALPPISHEGRSFKEEILASSRALFAKKKEDVEKEIYDWHLQSFADVKPATPKAEGGADGKPAEPYIPTEKLVPKPPSAAFLAAHPEIAAKLAAEAKAKTAEGGAPASALTMTPTATTPITGIPVKQKENIVSPIVAMIPSSTPLSNPVPPRVNTSLLNTSNTQVFEKRMFDRGNPNGQNRREGDRPNIPVAQNNTPRPKTFDTPRSASAVNTSLPRTETPRSTSVISEVSTPPKTQPLSLSALKKDARMAIAPTENRNTLKEALESLQKSKRVIPPQARPSEPEKPVAGKPPQKNTEQIAYQSKEIPEDILRGLLKVDE